MRANKNRTRNIGRVYDVMYPFIRNKSILHIGCAAHDAKKHDNDEEWLHELLSTAAAECVGVDILEEDIAELREAGYTAICADAQDLHLNREFEVIVAGELIEHLTDFDGFLRSVDRHLSPDGRIIITTPNAMALHWTILRFLDIEFINSEHTCWFDETTLTQLLGRYDFELETVQFLGDCELTRNDLLYSLGRVAEYTLPDRIGKSTLIGVAKRSK